MKLVKENKGEEMSNRVVSLIMIAIGCSVHEILSNQTDLFLIVLRAGGLINAFFGAIFFVCNELKKGENK